MNIIILILLVIGGLIAFLLILALLTKKEFNIQREITINRPKSEVFNYTRMLKNQEKYNVWLMKDPHAQILYTGTDGTVGATSAWKSENKHVGVGEQEIKKITEGERLDVEIRFEKPFEGIATTHFITEPVSADQTKVKWGMKGKSNYPMNFMNLFMDNMLGGDLETSLGNLKAILEK